MKNVKRIAISIIEQKQQIQCRKCKKVFDVPVTQKQIDDWKSGTPIQRAMPNLTSAQRELIKTQTCGECWDKLFKEGKYMNHEKTAIHIEEDKWIDFLQEKLKEEGIKISEQTEAKIEDFVKKQLTPFMKNILKEQQITNRVLEQSIYAL